MNVLNVLSKSILDNDVESRYYYNVALIFENRRKILVSHSINMLSHYHHGNCDTVHAEREAWRNMRRKRNIKNYRCSYKENYFIVSVRIRLYDRKLKFCNGGEFCNTCYNFLRKSQISYGYEYVDGNFMRVEFS